MLRAVSILCLLFVCALGTARAESQVDDLKREVENLRREIGRREDTSLSPIGKAESACDGKFGPNEAVTTKSGKLQIGGLVQVWYQTPQQSHQGLVRDVGGANVFGNTGFVDTNDVLDNSTFRVRRTELRMTMDVQENITGYMMMDPAREANVSFLPLPTFPAHNATLINPFFIQTGQGLAPGNIREGTGSGIFPSLLQDAYINFHGVVPHHDFTIGQFKPPSGEESWRNSGQLEFVERAMVTSINNVRDIGAMVHGTWFDNRFQYWIGGFNGPSGTILGDPDLLEGGNRSADHQSKDFVWRIAARPVWDADPEHWRGRFELGYARTDGYRGSSGNQFDPSLATNSLNEERTAINRQAAWAWYRPGGFIRGVWLRGEYGEGHDRFSNSGSAGALATSLLGLGGNNGQQLNPTPVDISGYYVGAGYKLSESIFADKLNSGWLGRLFKDTEYVMRFEQYQNVAAESLTQPDRHTDLFRTNALTMGTNYYLKGHDAKIQTNTIFVSDPYNRQRGFRNWHNDVFVVSFQVMF